jgi:hypothetical protein
MLLLLAASACAAATPQELAPRAASVPSYVSAAAASASASPLAPSAAFPAAAPALSAPALAFPVAAVPSGVVVAPAAEPPRASASALVFPPGSPLASVGVREVAPSIFHLHFQTQHLLTSTFLRFQEFYESPQFKGKVFTLDEFIAWYKTTRPDGRFSYYEDWGGFNIPSRVLARFYAGDFDPLSEKEKALLELFSGRENFYLIGTFGPDGDPETLRHEIAHGLYATNASYRAEVQELMKTVDLAPVFQMLKDLGYHEDVFLDEAHAYIGDAPADIAKEGVDPKPYAELHRKLLAVYARYADAPAP